MTGLFRRIATSLSLLIATLLSFAAACDGAAAQEGPAAGVVSDLTTMFEIGQLLADTNGDSVPDRVNGSLVLGATASTAELAAAAEVSARLGFETMALDLPIARGTVGAIPIVIGRSGLAAGCCRQRDGCHHTQPCPPSIQLPHRSLLRRTCAIMPSIRLVSFVVDASV